MLRTIVVCFAVVATLAAPTPKPQKCEVGSKAQYVKENTNALAPHGLSGSVALHAREEEDDGGFQINQLTNIADTERAIREHASVIMFHALWCPHCKHMKPALKSVAEQMAPLGIWFHMVDADTHRDIGGAFGVNGYPTVKYYSAKRGTSKDQAVEYEGGPNPEELANWVNSQHSMAYAAQ